MTRVLRHLESMASGSTPVALAIGFFDGVHLGHQAIVTEAQSIAHREHGEAWVLTFDVHPRRVLRKDAPPLLTSNRHKLLLLKRYGVDGCLLLPFTESFADTEPEAFAGDLLRQIPGLCGIVTGADWRFGRHGRGDGALLARMAGERQLRVTILPPVLDEGAPVSSTRVRAAIADGDILAASRLLGRPFSLLGTVVHGHGIGRRIGFPTANLDWSAEALPPTGVYAVHALIGDELTDGVLSYGTRPTLFDGAAPAAELHVPGLARDLYGQEVEVFFVGRLRGQQRFADEEALRRGIAGDVEAAMAALRGRNLKEWLYTHCFGRYIPARQRVKENGT